MNIKITEFDVLITHTRGNLAGLTSETKITMPDIKDANEYAIDWAKRVNANEAKGENTYYVYMIVNKETRELIFEKGA